MSDNNELIEYVRKPQTTNIGPEIEISCCSNVYIRRMIFKQAGIIELGHTHKFDHISYVSSGSISVQVYDQENKEMLPPKVFNAPATIFIAKGLVHQLKSLEDNTVVSCIHALRDITDDIVSPEMLPVPSSLLQTMERLKQQGSEIATLVIDDKFTDFRRPRPFDLNRSF